MSEKTDSPQGKHSFFKSRNIQRFFASLSRSNNVKTNDNDNIINTYAPVHDSHTPQRSQTTRVRSKNGSPANFWFNTSKKKRSPSEPTIVSLKRNPQRASRLFTAFTPDPIPIIEKEIEIESSTSSVSMTEDEDEDTILDPSWVHDENEEEDRRKRLEEIKRRRQRKAKRATVILTQADVNFGQYSDLSEQTSLAPSKISTFNRPTSSLANQSPPISKPNKQKQSKKGNVEKCADPDTPKINRNDGNLNFSETKPVQIESTPNITIPKSISSRTKKGSVYSSSPETSSSTGSPSTKQTRRKSRENLTNLGKQRLSKNSKQDNSPKIGKEIPTSPKSPTRLKSPKSPKFGLADSGGKDEKSKGKPKNADEIRLLQTWLAGESEDVVKRERRGKGKVPLHELKKLNRQSLPTTNEKIRKKGVAY